jgi:hypothetical protein
MLQVDDLIEPRAKQILPVSRRSGGRIGSLAKPFKGE